MVMIDIAAVAGEKIKLLYLFHTSELMLQNHPKRWLAHSKKEPKKT